MYKSILTRSIARINSFYSKRRSASLFSVVNYDTRSTNNSINSFFITLFPKRSFITKTNFRFKTNTLVDKIGEEYFKKPFVKNQKRAVTSSPKDEQTNQFKEKRDEESRTDTEEELKNDKESGNGDDGDKKPENKLFKYVPAGMYGGATLVFSGILLSYYIERREELKHYKLSQVLDDLTQYVYDKIEELFPPDNSPLLPDFDELKYPPNLPTLVIDLDKVIAKMEYDRKHGWQVKKRPYADKFFKELINYFEIVIWSDDPYPVAYDVANLWGLPVIGCIHRDHCKKFKGGYIKDLSRLGRNLNRVILVDHDRIACSLQEENAILVREFDGDEADQELLYLINLLKTIAINPQDVKTQIRQMGGGHDYQLGRRFTEQYSLSQERAKSRMNMTKMFGFKHYQ
ncbi:hypothetical protein MACK_000826 [Theileria orientalis]|uniref:Mitochondrial import inner membrane translocase subunit TIM50 n=1 Tax=Theileria orientalis TaxID=68886 RepID=A0A976MAJ3_THEOR|nr:hypothetical protein MACK_000826 [Theileria orientalis]